MTTGRSTQPINQQSINCCVIAKGTEGVNNAVGRSRKRRGKEGTRKGVTAVEYYSSSSYFPFDLFPSTCLKPYRHAVLVCSVLSNSLAHSYPQKTKPCGRCFWACTEEKRRVAPIVLVWPRTPAATTGFMALDIENWRLKGQVFGHGGRHTRAER